MFDLKDVDRHLSGSFCVVNKQGSIVLTGQDLRSICGKFMQSNVLDYFTLRCIPDRKVISLVVPTGVSDILLHGSERAAEKWLTRLEEKSPKHNLFKNTQIHFMRLGGVHFNVVSLIKCTEEGYHVYSHCSLGRPPDEFLAVLIQRLGNFYEKGGKGTFELKNFRVPTGKGSPRAARQAGCVSCGAHAALSVQSMLCWTTTFPKIQPEIVGKYRRYMALKVLEHVQQDDSLSLVEERKSRKVSRSGVSIADGVIDLTGDE